MPKRTSKTGGELFIVDNSDDDWKVLRYLRDWCDLSKAIDVATGYFEIGSLLALDGQWQKLDNIRILMGDAVSKRTRAAFAEGLANIQARLDRSLEDEKDKNDFLTGAPAIAEAIRSGKIQCRVYRKDKFHAKAYITHARQEDELDELLRLYSKVTHKTLRISKTLGIETGKLLRPDDDFEALKEFNHAYEGETSFDETLQLELNALLAAEPELAARLESLPGRVFSGKAHPTAGARGVFFCYRLPRPEAGRRDGEAAWSEEAGVTRWYLYDLDRDNVVEAPADIIALIRSDRGTPRRCTMPQAALSEIRAKIEKHIKNTFLKQLQAPLGVKPVLKAWMELN